MSTRTPWRPEPQEQPVPRTPEEVLDKPPRRWPVPLMVLLAVLLGMGAGAWIAGNNERALDATAQRLVELSEQLESVRGELATARDDLTGARARLVRLHGVEQAADTARQDNAAALEDLEQVVLAAAEMFDGLPARVTTGLAPGRRDLSVLERSFAAADAGDQEAFRRTFTRDGWLTIVFGGLHQELRGDEIGLAVRSLVDPKLVGEPAQTGALVWSRYRAADTSGVVVTRLRDDTIAHQWLVPLHW